ncbi:hypothetical protein HPP92_018099 [Vanilla planifolia]|uniref:Uncharacterized protein n=1 Tax=Vanilla planifolia TaxID=51239 RepID=A0A835Q964_VANPL|nr:hypothetical protein HPP92_018687 [Vanilla planifolia]KAG0468771.1 hypothetical protein HPP92_018099 [Vanilla planifolia]
MAICWMLPLNVGWLSFVFIYTTNHVAKLVKRANPKIQEFIPCNVFEEPKFSIFFCAMLGSGLHYFPIIFASVVVQLLKATKIYVADSIRPLMVTSMMFAFIGFATGYVVVLLFRAMKLEEHECREWPLLSLLTTMFSMGDLFYIKIMKDDTAISFSRNDALVSCLWLAITTPTMQLGGYFGAKSKKNGIKLYLSSVGEGIRLKEGYGSFAVALACGFLAMLVLYYEICDELVRAFLGDSKTMDSIVLVAFVMLLTFATLYQWSIISHIWLISGKLRCCWWPFFLSWAVPLGVYSLFRVMIHLDMTRKLNRPVFDYRFFVNVIGYIVNLIGFGTIGVISGILPKAWDVQSMEQTEMAKQYESLA